MIDKKLIGGALSLTASGLIVKFLGLIYKIPLSYMLSDEGMSYFNSAYTVYAFFFVICTAGIPKAVSILVAEADSVGADSEKIYKGAFRFFLACGFVLSALFAFFAGEISSFIGSGESRYSMLSVAPSIFFVCAAGVLRGYFNGKLDFLCIAFSELISGGARLVFGLSFAFIAYKIGMPLFYSSALTMLGTTIGSFLGFVYLMSKKKSKTENKLGQNKYTYGRENIKRILRLAFPLTLTGAVGSISSVVDISIILNRLRCAGYNEFQSNILYGNYTTLSVPMFNLIATLIAPVCTVLLPWLSASGSASDIKSLTKNVRSTVAVISTFCVPAVFLFAFCSGDILAILFEDSSASMSAPLLALLAPGVIFMCLLTVINTSLEALKNTVIPLTSMIIVTVVKLGCSYIFIGDADIGILGASVATCLAYFVGFAFVLIYAVCRNVISVRILTPIIPVMIYSVIAISVVNLLKNVIVKDGAVVSLINLIVFAIIYCSLYYIFSFKRVKSSLKSS